MSSPTSASSETSTKPLTIWCNAQFSKNAMDELVRRVRSPHRLIFPGNLSASNLVATGPDQDLVSADIAFGQPDPQQVIALPNLRWIHITSAGYTRYDRDDVRAALRSRGAHLTNSSAVYDEPCAEHAFAMMLALGRRLPQCVDDQRSPHRPWNAAEHRIQCRLLTGQNVLILGAGAIPRRLVELLQPLRMNVTCVRRTVSGRETSRTISVDRLNELLPSADHVVNILPLNASTEGMIGVDRFACMKQGVVFYNIGRGTTIDQNALLAALRSGRVAATYLDVTDPEPLPAEHPLWTTPNCYITPHTAGGSAGEFHELVHHFLDNLKRFECGEPLMDQVI